MYELLHDRGLEILAFPSNQFGNQEPGSDAEIQEFCSGYGISFPVFSKVLTCS
jgi:glutathione peroxidase